MPHQLLRPSTSIATKPEGSQYQPGVFLAGIDIVLKLAFIFLALPLVLPAQIMPATVIRRSGTNGLAMSDGEPISFVLEHAAELDLTDPQRMGLINLRRRLRAINEPFMEQLDSLRESVGLSLEPRPRGLDDEDHQRLERFELLARPVTDVIKVNNDGANLQMRALLDSAQIVRLDSLVVSERGTISGRRPPTRPGGSKSSRR